jgi:hypothetical protein
LLFVKAILSFSLKWQNYSSFWKEYYLEQYMMYELLLNY